LPELASWLPTPGWFLCRGDTPTTSISCNCALVLFGPTIDRLRDRLDTWLGEPKREQGRESGSSTDLNLRSLRSFRLRLKIETNTREHFVLKGTAKRFLAVESRWWDGNASFTTDFPICENPPVKVGTLQYEKRK
jgi:hypothetical protein